MSVFRREGEALRLFVKLTPRAKQNCIIGEKNGRLAVSLNAPPVEGAANKALIAFLAKELGHPKSRIVIEKGLKSREKELRLFDFCDDLALEKLCRTQ